MKRIIIFLFLSIGLVFAQHKQVIIKQYKTADTESVRDIDVRIDDQEITVKLNIDGEETVLKANPNNEEEVKALEEMLAEMDIDVDILNTDSIDPDLTFIEKPGGYLGVHIDDITDQLRDYFKVKGDGGVLITEVVDNSPAGISGLQAGDIIIKINDQRISNPDELQFTIRSFEPDEKVNITLIRKGRKKSFNVVLGKAEGPQLAFQHFMKDNFLNDIPGLLSPGYPHKWHMSGDDMDDYLSQMKDREDFAKQIDQLREEMEALRNELKELRTK